MPGLGRWQGSLCHPRASAAGTLESELGMPARGWECCWNWSSQLEQGCPTWQGGTGRPLRALPTHTTPGFCGNPLGILLFLLHKEELSDRHSFASPLMPLLFISVTSYFVKKFCSQNQRVSSEKPQKTHKKKITTSEVNLDFKPQHNLRGSLNYFPVSPATLPASMICAPTRPIFTINHV